MRAIWPICSCATSVVRTKIASASGIDFARFIDNETLAPGPLEAREEARVGLSIS